MPYYSFNGFALFETDLGNINTILNKGGILISDPPSYNPHLQYYPEWNGNQWMINDISAEQLKQNNYTNFINTGYLVSPEQFTLGLQINDISQFTSFITLLQEAQSLGFINDNTIQTIFDINGNIQTVTTFRLRQIMVGYGLYYKQLKDSLIS